MMLEGYLGSGFRVGPVINHATVRAERTPHFDGKLTIRAYACVQVSVKLSTPLRLCRRVRFHGFPAVLIKLLVPSKRVV